MSPATKSPYERRSDEIDEWRKKSGDNHVAWYVADPLGLLEKGRLAEIAGQDDVDEISEEERQAVCNKLTHQEVQDTVRVVQVPRDLLDIMDKLTDDIRFADPRNDRGSCLLILNTHSSRCMYPVIGKMLTDAVKEINKELKSVNNAALADTTNMAASAFKVSVATIMAVYNMDHWRIDTESEEEVEKIEKKIVKLVKDLLFFDDNELGFADPFSRLGLLHVLGEIVFDWEKGTASHLTPKNGHEMGRSKPPPPAAKKKGCQGIASSSRRYCHGGFCMRD